MLTRGMYNRSRLEIRSASHLGIDPSGPTLDAHDLGRAKTAILWYK